MGITAKSRQKRAISAPRPDKVDTPQKARKGGRPRKKTQQEAFERENLLFETPYTDDELSALWRGFRNQPDAVKMLADFANTSKADAAAMISRWEHSNEVTFTSPPVSPDSWDW